MKTPLKILISVLFGVILSACSNESSNSAQAAPLKPDVTVSDNSKTTTPFDYSSLMYMHSGLCGTQDTQDRFVNVYPVKIGTAADGKDIYAETNLLIYPNGTYIAEYQEEDMIYYMETKAEYKRYRVRNLMGYWGLVDGKLKLNSFGILEAHLEENRIVAEFTYQEDIVSSGLSGKVANAGRVSSSSAIKFGREVCPAAEDIPGKFAGFMNQSHSLQSELQSLQMLPQQTLASGSISVTHLELFLETDGRYYILVKILDQNVPLGKEKTYIVDDFSWERVFNTLDLYSGNLSIIAPTNQVELKFDRDLQLVENEKIVGVLQTTGKSIRMGLQKSSYTMDDLTSVYADGGAPIYSH